MFNFCLFEKFLGKGAFAYIQVALMWFQGVEKEDIEASRGLSVRYADYNWWWAPLDALYYSSSSKVLVSRHPDSCIDEIVSYYCPQCLMRYMDDEVARYGKRCPKCHVCPGCNSVLTDIVTDGDTTLLHCDYCFWEIDKDKVVPTTASSDDADSSQREKKIAAAAAYKVLLEHLSTFKESSTRARTRTSSRVGDAEGNTALWRWEDADNLYNSLGSGNGRDDDPVFASRKSSTEREREECSGLLLRTKRTLRCRRDVENGNMSILLQPKNFALEGDSSLKLQRGKWSVKDSSATYRVPHVTGISRDANRLTLVVRNPVDDAIFVQLLPVLIGMPTTERQLVDAYMTTAAPSPAIKLDGYEDALLEIDESEHDAGTNPTPKAEGWVIQSTKNTATIITPTLLHKGYASESCDTSSIFRLLVRMGDKEDFSGSTEDFHIVIFE